MSRRSFPFVQATVCLAATTLGGAALAQTNTKTFIDYLRPAPIACPLSSDTWGGAGVIPRDTCNGIESTNGAGKPPSFFYWDGKIIRAKDGNYHMFMSTWLDSASFHPGWINGESYHAVSTKGVLGPYERKGYIFDNNGSHHGHNTSAAELLDGSYAVVVSEVVPFTIYKSTSLDGPWTACPNPTGELIKENGINGGTDKRWDSNVSLTARADGKFEIVQRHGFIAIADTLCGPYLMQKPTWTYPKANLPTVDSIYPRRTSPGTHDWEEDPVLWYSGGRYHVVYDSASDRQGYELSSPDGIHDWKDGGIAYDVSLWKKIFGYEGSQTASQWQNVERTGVVLENGHLTHVTWAVTDSEKMTLPAGSNHGSKIIVVPFDGVAFDKDNGWIDPGTGPIDGGQGTIDSGTSGDAARGADGSAGASGSDGATSRGGSSGVTGTGGAGGATGTPGGASGSGVTGSGGRGGDASSASTTASSTTAAKGNPQSTGCSCRVGTGSVGRGELGFAIALWLLWRRRRHSAKPR
jgi:hypothetical protein